MAIIRFAVLFLTLLSLGCAKHAPPAPGQLMVTLVTDLAPPKDFDELRVLVTYKGEAKHDTTYALRGGSAIKLPATFAVIAGSEPATPVDVHVEARLRGKVVVVRDARTTVPGDRIANLTIPIEFLCVGQVSGSGVSLCAADRTCMGGSCGPSTVDASTLPTFDPSGVFGGAKEPGASGRCFDVLECFGDAEPVTPDDACSLAIPADRGSGLNVALLNAERTQGICASNACLVVLDNDAARGWVEANGRIQLPAAACTPARPGSRALVATRCATKKPSDPPCGSWSSSGSVATDGTLVEINLGDAGLPPGSDGGVGASDAGPQDSCSQNNGGCSAYATCAVGDAGSPVCACRPGYTGDGLGCIDVNECLVDRGGCAVDATCTNIPGSRTCACNSGFSGDGTTCTDVDECATQNGGCSADATCTNRPGFRTCTCNSGFSGDGLTCTDVNECVTSNGGCDANATCTNNVGGRSCACNTGYEGNGVTCTDVNECATANGGCAAFAQCTNLAGGRSCACQPGFSGDGVSCANNDECAANATICGPASAGSCTDTPGAYACMCRPGYTLENGTCVDLNECATNNGGCSANATCTNTTGSRSCACNGGWSGDGVTCACTGESDASLCARAGQNCGALTATDNCGTVRSLASCGSCGNNATCGTGAASGVCACNAGYVGNGTTCVVDQTCTAVSGVLTQNTTWTAAQSPYCVNGNVLVSQGVTLTVEAGVLAKFAVGKSMQVDGTLKVLGTEQAHVAFDCQRPAVNNDPEACWGQLKFTDTAEDAVLDAQGNYVSGSILRWLDLSRAGNVANGKGAVELIGALPVLSHCDVGRNATTGLYLSRTQSALQIIDTRFHSNSRHSSQLPPGTYEGGAIRAEGACFNLVRAFIYNNSSLNTSTIHHSSPFFEDGQWYSGCTSTVIESLISNNISNAFEDAAAGIYANGDISITRTTFRNNGAASVSTIAMLVGSLQIDDSIVANSGGIGVSTRAGSVPSVPRWISIRNSLITHAGDIGLRLATVGIGGTTPTDRPKPNWMAANETIRIEGCMIHENNGGLISQEATNSARLGVIGTNFRGNRRTAIYHAFEGSFDEGARPSSYATADGLSIETSTIIHSDGSALRINGSGGRVSASAFVIGAGLRSPATFGLTAGLRIDDIFLRTGGGTLERNNFFGIVAFGIGSPASSLSGRNNYWGTTSDSAIQSILWDWNDDSSLGFINYTPFLTSPSTDAPLLPPSGVTKAVSGTGVRVSWNANTESDLAGYRVFWGSSDGFFWAHSAEVPSGTSYVIPNVGISERFAVAAYDTTRSGVSYTDRVSGHEGWPTEAVGP